MAGHTRETVGNVSNMKARKISGEVSAKYTAPEHIFIR
jgi:hypothetical protein